MTIPAVEDETLNITFSETDLGALQANLALATTRHERKGQD